jgi:hypothetical protein
MNVAQAIQKSGLSELEFFQTAYLKIFGKVHNCVNDVVQYRQHSIVPPYITKYIQKMYG